MRTMLDREEETTDSEVTLSAATLLGIFFGLVLICGVFFGFGYSIGRRGTESPAAASTAKPALAAESEPTAPASQPTPKPSAMQTLQAATTDNGAADNSSNTVTQPLEESSAAPVRPTPATAPATPPAPKVVRAAATQPAKQTPTPASLPITPASTPAVSAAGNFAVMVQIAAVSHQEDADVLVAALRKHGYSVSARNEPQDKLLHVQVGPFASKDAARAMRAKLAADGYNAILK